MVSTPGSRRASRLVSWPVPVLVRHARLPLLDGGDPSLLSGPEEDRSFPEQPPVKERAGSYLPDVVADSGRDSLVFLISRGRIGLRKLSRLPIS